MKMKAIAEIFLRLIEGENTSSKHEEIKLIEKWRELVFLLLRLLKHYTKNALV